MTLDGENNEQSKPLPQGENVKAPVVSEQAEVDPREEIRQRVLNAAIGTIMGFIDERENSSGIPFPHEKEEVHHAWENFENKATESRETLETPPFRIRGHHLRLYRNLMTALDAQERASLLRGYIENDRKEGLKSPGMPGNAYKVEYANDVIGPPERGEAYQEYLKKMFQEFVALPDDAPVEVTEGIKDNLCFGCALGKHCVRKFVDGNPNFSILREDQEAVSQLLQDVEGMQSEQQESLANISWETMTFADTTEPEKVRRVSMKAGTVKKILAAHNEIRPNNEVQHVNTDQKYKTETPDVRESNVAEPTTKQTESKDITTDFTETGGMPPDVFERYKAVGEKHLGTATLLIDGIPGAYVTTERDQEDKGGAIRVVNWYVPEEYQKFFNQRQEEYINTGIVTPFSGR